MINEKVKGTISGLSASMLGSFNENRAKEICQIESPMSFGYNASEKEHAFFTSPGGYITFLRYMGYSKLITDEELERTRTYVAQRLQTLIGSGSHTIEFVYESDPENKEDFLFTKIHGMNATAKRIGLRENKLAMKNAKLIADKIVHERLTIAFTTYPNVVSGDDLNKAYDVAVEDQEKYYAHLNEHDIKAPDSSETIGFHGASKEVYRAHETALERAREVMTEAGMMTEILDKKEAGHLIGAQIDPRKFGTGWTPHYWGDSMSPTLLRESKISDMDQFAPVHLGSQFLSAPMTYDARCSKIGEYWFAPMAFGLFPQDIDGFEKLVRNIPKHVPWRYKLKITPVSADLTDWIRKPLIAVGAFSEKLTKNHKIKDSIKAINSMEPTERAQCTVIITTWAKDREEAVGYCEDIRQRMLTWGSPQMWLEKGNAGRLTLDGVTGYTSQSIAPKGILTMKQALTLAPIGRPMALIENATTLFMTQEGTLFPYAPGNNQQTRWFEIYCAPPRAGKSLQGNTINQNLCYSPGLERLPFIRSIDVYPSSRGQVELIRSELPPDRKDEAIYKRLQLSEKDGMNPLDLYFGQKKPAPQNLTANVDYLMILYSNDPGNPPQFLKDFLSAVLDQAYDYFAAVDTAKRYIPGKEPEIDRFLERQSAWQDRDKDTFVNWWDVRDWLFEEDNLALARKAQRRAAPTIPDLSKVIRETPTLKQRFANAPGDASGSMKIQEYFEITTETIQKSYPNLCTTTRLDVDGARILSLDLADVTASAGMQQQAAMYLQAIRYAIMPITLVQDMVVHFDPMYRSFTERKIRNMQEDLKRLHVDEFHNCSKHPLIIPLFDKMQAEQAKNGLQMALFSQQPDHFPSALWGYASTVFMIGSFSPEAIKRLSELKELPDSAIKALKEGRTHNPRPETGPGILLHMETKNYGNVTQLLHAPFVPEYLWALSTTQDDTNLRTAVYKLFGDDDVGRKVLAQRFPQGTATQRIEAVREEMANDPEQRGEDGESVALKTVTDEVVREFQVRNGVTVSDAAEAIQRYKEM